MKKFSLFMAAVLASAALVAIPSNAAVNGDGVLKYTPVIDGKIDAAYMQSANVTHDFPAERDSSNYWGSGKFEFTDREKDEKGEPLPDSVGHVTAYGWDIQATSYFLWDDENLYVAVRIVDDDVTGVSDAKYNEAVEDYEDYGLWLTDAIAPCFTYKGMNCTLRVEAVGRFGTAYDSPESTNWIEWATWHNHQPNKDNGLYVVSRTTDGYIVEMKLPVNESTRNKLMKDGGSFSYGLSVCDIPMNFKYGIDPAHLEEGVVEENFNSEDFMLWNDLAQYGGGKYKLKLSANTPTVDPNADASLETTAPDNTNNQTPSNGNSGNTNNDNTAPKPAAPNGGNSAAQTSDIGIAVAAASLVAAAAFIVIKKRK